MSRSPDSASTESEANVLLRHEVMNPLAIIRGYTQLLQRRLQRPDAVNEQTIPSVLVQLAIIDAAVSQIVLAMDTFEQTTERPQEEPDSG